MSNQYLFNKRKNFIKSKLVYIGFGLIFLIGLWVSQALNPDDPGEVNVTPDDLVVSKDVPSDSNNDISENKNSEANNSDKQTSINNQNPVVLHTSEAYYLLKESDGEVKLFYYDESGNETFIRATEIPFSLISESDQNEFVKGMIVETEEELYELLQDFES